jgi:hypothetical protein
MPCLAAAAVLLWQRIGVFNVVKTALVVEAFAADQSAKDFEPFVALIVAGLVIQHVDAEHRELVLTPAADDVETGAAVADVVDRGDGLGGKYRMDERHVHGDKNRDAMGERGTAELKPGQSLTFFQDVAVLVRLGHDGAAGNTTGAVDCFTRRVKDGHIRQNGPEAFGHLPAANGATEIDVGNDHVN